MMLFLLSLGFPFYLVLKKLSELYVKPTFTFTPSGLNNVTQHIYVTHSNHFPEVFGLTFMVSRECFIMVLVTRSLLVLDPNVFISRCNFDNMSKKHIKCLN